MAALPTSTPLTVPASQIRAPTAFLSLAPTTSESYPTQKPARDLAAASDIDIVKEEGLKKTRRSSSLSSDSSTASGSGKPRFLKLGPVHWGESVDGNGDWSEESVAE